MYQNKNISVQGKKDLFHFGYPMVYNECQGIEFGSVINKKYDKIDFMSNNVRSSQQ